MGARRFVAVGLGAIAMVVMAAAHAAAQGTVTGVVTAEGGAPLSAVQVQIEGTALGSLTGEDGRYTIRNVPAGVYAIEARRIGYAPGRQDNIRVTDGTVTVDFALRVSALRLQKEVVTGLVDPTSGVKAPFVVERVEAPEVPPPPGNPVEAIAGKVAGARLIRPEGKPGSETTVQLRTPASLNKETEPLYVVDGVVLGVGAGLVDFNSMDIESIEIVKGAAAASLYGSRAANGVIQIKTRRGENLELDRTSISFRSEYGVSRIAETLNMNRSHAYAMTAAQDAFIRASDSTTIANDNRVDRFIDGNRIMDNPWPGPTYDHMDRFYEGGSRLSNYLSIGQNTQATNWMATIGSENETGVVQFLDGFRQTSGRLNIDHRLTEKLNLAFSGYHARSRSDEYATVTANDYGIFVTGAANPFYDILFFPADVDLTAPNLDGEPYVVKPDPKGLQVNPLYSLSKIDAETRRERTAGNMSATYRPIGWLTVEGLIGYDNSVRNHNYWEPKGMKQLSWDTTAAGITAVSQGQILRNEGRTTALNGQLSGTVLYAFDRLTTRTTVRGLFERQQDAFFQAQTTGLSVERVPDFDVGTAPTATGGASTIKSNGFLAHTGLDFDGKYIGDVLVRRDGSSLFGEDQRYHWYYRVSGAYRMAQEDWWPIPALNEFKVRLSRGTAGGRPNFPDQYESWNVTSSGISKFTLGNSELKPEHATETEFGIDAIFNNRHSIQLTYALNKTEDQLLLIPQPAVTGYSARWENAATVEGNTFEATIESQIITRPDMRWSLGLVFDRSRSEITEFNANCYRENYITNSAGSSLSLQNQTVGYRCAGVQLGAMYGAALLRSPSQLPAGAQPSASEFQINDDGLLVWVGPGGDFRDTTMWGTTGSVGGRTYNWGRPIVFKTSNGAADSLVQIGDGNPSFNWGMTNSFTWKNFNFYALVAAQVGGDIYNHTKQWSYRDHYSADQDQAGKPRELRKPQEYYQDLYNTDATLDWFVEDGSFIKLRELSLRYDLPRARFMVLDRFGFQGITLGLVGRNLLTISDYSGFDPEVGTVNARVDDFGYPPFRTFTGYIELKF